ncbi:MAG: polysaccharide biosynthesis/export family protein [Phycisphaeraceae bacterium]|nr:polysaccharide biosynthesis/export family protein [Phycisphaeraceae bacterium]
MQQSHAGRLKRAWLAGACGLAALLTGVGGCEMDSFMDSSAVGRFERTPTILPILNQLDVIDEPQIQPAGLSEVQPEDLVPEVREYVIGPGDLLTVTVFELIQENVEAVQTRRVNNLGQIRLPVIGTVVSAGKSPTELEDEIIDVLQRKDVLHDPTVSVVVQEPRQNTYSIVGEPRYGGTAFGTFSIIKDDFRLMDAIALSQGIPGNIKTIYVYRQVALYKQPSPAADAAEQPSQMPPAPQTSAQTEKATSELIDDLLAGVDQGPPAAATEPSVETQPAPEMIESTLEQPSAEGGAWVNVGGKWVQAPAAQQPSGEAPAASAEMAPAAAEGAAEAMPEAESPRQAVLTQRIIQIPYDKLIAGDMRYNVVIRPGDIIRVPPPALGNVYVEGQIARPGTYGLPGDGDLTIKNLVAAAGGLGALAIPERVDLIRRIDKDREAWVRINLRSIYNGTQPDLFLKPNDQVIFGTNFFAFPLQVVRSGFRVSYGFGFLLDRNFGNDVFGAPPGS